MSSQTFPSNETLDVQLRDVDITEESERFNASSFMESMKEVSLFLPEL
jgi:hypothetical protein